MAESTGINIDVLTEDQGFLISFPYDRDLVNMINKVEGAEFDKTEDAWRIPKTSEEELNKVVDSMQYESKAIAADREAIYSLATASASERMLKNGTSAEVSPKLSEYIDPSKFYAGEIINVNGRFAAQISNDFGKDNGAAFVTIHRLSNLDNKIYKGDNVLINYSSNSLAKVTDNSNYKSSTDMAKEFDSTLGTEVDGVIVGEIGDKYHIVFKYNEEMGDRLRRMDRTEYDQAAKAFVVPVDMKDFVVKAVSDIRSIYVEDLKERESLLKLAESKIDGPKLSTYIKDGFSYSGEIIGDSNRYVMQDRGRGEFLLHRKSNLTQSIEVNDKARVSIGYKNGRASIEAPKEKSKSTGLSR